MMKTAVLLPALIASLSLVGCSKDQSSGGVVLSSTELQSERIDMQPATLEQCANGGTELKTYIDLNGNSALDTGEKILASYVVCAGANGTDGKDGSNGSDGKDGTDGKDGVDGSNGSDGKDGSNGSDGKDGSNGSDGKDGSNGSDGKDGADGKDGVDGKDGASPYAIVFAIIPEAPSCKNGGSTITFALDVNGNGRLDEEDKHTQSTEICNGTNGKDGEVAPAEPDFTCSVKVKSSSSWKEGYIVDISITYKGPARTGWKAAFTLPENQQIVNIWNAAPSAMKGSIVASSYSHNEKLESGSVLTFGFQVERSNNLMITDSSFSLNGFACKN